MKFEINGWDDEGNPTHVITDSGFCQTGRKFEPESDGWMLGQLEYSQFPAIFQAQQMKALVDEVNTLRRDIFILEKELKIYRSRAW